MGPLDAVEKGTIACPCLESKVYLEVMIRFSLSFDVSLHSRYFFNLRHRKSIYIKAKRAGWPTFYFCTFVGVLLGDGGLLLCSGGVFFLVSSRSVSW
jgi:hypothetical protein